MSDQALKIIQSTTGMDGVIASGNTPLWIVQKETIGAPLTDQATTFPLTALTTATDTVKADCHMNMDGFSATRNLTNRDRKRMCEKFTQSVKTGESIDLTLSAIYDQQAGAEDLINAVYTALPEGQTVYVVQAYGWDSQKPVTAETKVDVYRMNVQQRSKNQPVDGEDLMFTATGSGDLYLQDVKLA